MSTHDSRTRRQDKPAQPAATEKRREEALTRLRSALLEDRLELMEHSDESTGTDPYNSGIHRAMVKGHVWKKRSR